MVQSSTATELCPACGQPYSAHTLDHDDSEGGMKLVCASPVDEESSGDSEQAVVGAAN